MRPLLRRVSQLQRLAVFDAVASAGGFTAGATELGITQPAVSRHMKTLSRDLGIELFERRGRGFELTPAGRSLASSLHETFSSLERTIDELLAGDTLVFAVQASMATSWIVPMLDQLEQSTGSGIRLMMYDRLPELDRDRWDLAIVPGHVSEMATRGWTTSMLFHETVRPFAAPVLASALSLNENSAASELRTAPLLHIDATDRPSMTWADWFESTETADELPPARHVYTSYPAVLQEALAGNGIVLGWRHLMSDLVERNLLVPVGCVAQRTQVGQHICWQRAHDDPRFTRIRDHLTAAVGAAGGLGFD